jgi:hypothetical protein
MKRSRILVALALAGVFAVAVADTPVAKKVADPAPAASLTKADAAPASATAACVLRCEKAESTCSSQVRRARADCSKKAAAGGRDPMLMRRDYPDYFCGYFGADHCARDPLSKDCRNRFSRRHGVCVNQIEGNIAAQRYDCFVNERDAQTFCRDELRDCKEVCGG